MLLSGWLHPCSGCSTLDVSSNNLAGTVPSTFSMLTNLGYVGLWCVVSTSRAYVREAVRVTCCFEMSTGTKTHPLSVVAVTSVKPCVRSLLVDGAWSSMFLAVPAIGCSVLRLDSNYFTGVMPRLVSSLWVNSVSKSNNCFDLYCGSRQSTCPCTIGATPLSEVTAVTAVFTALGYPVPTSNADPVSGLSLCVFVCACVCVPVCE